MYFSLFVVVSRALNTPKKCTITYASDTSRNDNVRQKTATRKCTFTYASNTRRDDYL